MTPYVYVPAQLNSALKPSLEITKEMDFICVHFLGIADAAQNLFAAYENQCTFSIRPNGLWEMIFDTLSAEEISKLLSEHRYLKATGFIEDWSIHQVYTFLSDSGYPFITAHSNEGIFDKHADGGAGRFAHEIDVLCDEYHARFIHIQTGSSVRVEYSYPFKDKWEEYDFIVRAEDGTLKRTRRSQPFLFDKNRLVQCFERECDVVVPDGVEFIDDTAFPLYTGVTSVSLPDSIRPEGFLQKNPLRRMDALRKPVYNRSCSMLFRYAGGLRHFEVPASVKYIACVALADPSLKSVTLPEGLLSVGDSAFNYSPWNQINSKGIQSVTIPASVHTLGSQTLSELTILGDLENCGTLICNTLTVKGSLKTCAGINTRILNIDGTFPADTEIGEGIQVIRAPKMPFSTYTAITRKPALIGFAQMRREGLIVDKEISDGYIAYIKRQKKNLYALCGQHPDILRLMIGEKLIPAEDIALLLPILEKADKISEISELLAYKESISVKAADPFDDLSLDEKPKRKSSKAKQYDPFSPSEIKKEWAFEKLPDGTIRLTACKSTSANIYIPERVGKDPVTELSDFLFSPAKPRLSAALKEARYSTVHISVPSGVKVIGDSAFAGCTALKSLSLPDTLTVIGREAMSGCTALTDISLAESPTFFLESGVLYERLESGVKAVFACNASSCTLREDTVELAAALFKGCAALTHITLPSSIREVSDSAFSMCTNLQHISLPEGLTAVGASAFFGCKALSEIALPASLVQIGASAFEESGLISVSIPSGVGQLSECAFQNCTALKTLILNEGITCIGARAFRYCHALESMNFPSTLSTIGSEAFRQCFGFTKLDIPATVTNIMTWGFARCDNAVFMVRQGSAAHQYAAENFYQFNIVE